MNIFKRLFGKSKIEKESENPDIKLKSTVTPEPTKITRNAKGQFIKGVTNPYVKRDSVTGRFKSKKPTWEAPRD